MTIGLNIKANQSDLCEDCIINKCTNASHPIRTTRKASKPGLVLHADTAGPMPAIGFNDQRFILVCKDEYSGFRMTACIKKKSDIPQELIKLSSTPATEQSIFAPMKVVNSLTTTSRNS